MDRVEQAKAEVGHTRVSARVAWTMAAAFLATTLALGVAEPLARWGAAGEALAPPWRRAVNELSSRSREARSAIGEGAFLAANRNLRAGLDGFERALEEDSLLQERLLPVAQAALLRLGLGNESAYLGREGSLFYRPDVDYVTGPGFLEPRILARRALDHQAWEPEPHPDPRPALIELDADLRRLGIALLLVPTPVKPVLEPGRFASRALRARPPVHNPSYPPLLAELRAAGLGIVDLDAALLLLLDRQPTLFLDTDTHWMPTAVEEAARMIADAIERLGVLGVLDDGGGGASGTYQRRDAMISGRGDIAAMLHLPSDNQRFGEQRVAVSIVTEATGRPWRADPRAEVLILGDSFTNVYSDPGLGWGTGAGLAEQLAFALQRPVDRIALNAGGAHAAREALAREPGRLQGKRVVIYQFAVRELASGDWRRVPLVSPDPKSQQGAEP